MKKLVFGAARTPRPAGQRPSVKTRGQTSVSEKDKAAAQTKLQAEQRAKELAVDRAREKDAARQYKVIEIISGELDIDEQKCRIDTPLGEEGLGADADQIKEIFDAVEEEFSIEFTTAERAAIDTIGDLLVKVAEKQA